MALLSQALHLGYLLSPHSAFQEHAAHTARWPAMLSPNGSSDTCIADGVFHIPMPCFHGAIPVYPKVLLHFSIMLHGAAQVRGTGPSIYVLWGSPWSSPRWSWPTGGCRSAGCWCASPSGSSWGSSFTPSSLRCPSKASARPGRRNAGVGVLLWDHRGQGLWLAWNVP